jgi:Tol biopolymer transport system component
MNRPEAIVIALAVCSMVMTLLPAQAQVLRQLTDLNRDGFAAWGVDDGGGTAVAVWKGDPLGTNPDHAYQIFKWALPGGSAVQLTSFPAGVHRTVSITDDGQWLVFDSAADPLEQNGDGTVELFLMRADGTDITQLTDDDVLGGGGAECPMISGSGNRVLFYGTYDPLGTNPEHLTQLFIIDLASSNITQLTQGDSGIRVPHSSNGRCYPSISDDGERVAFSSSADLTGVNPAGYFQVYRIDADGQDLTQLTLFNWDSLAWGISGNGERIVFVNNGFGHGDPIRVVNWEGTEIDGLVSGYDPTINDSGTHVYFNESGNVYSILSTGGTPRVVAPSSPTVSNVSAVISGSRTRIVFVVKTSTCPGGPELAAMDQNGNGLEQLTVSEDPGWSYEPDIAASGTRVVYRGGIACGVLGIFRVDTDGSDPVSVLAAESVENVTVTGDGGTVVFMSYDDLAGSGTGSVRDVFRVQADGSGLAQLTFSDYDRDSAQPVVAANGSPVVFQSYNGSFGGLTGDLFSIPTGGGTVVPIVEDHDTFYKRPTISANGTWAAWHARVTGTEVQVYRGRTDGTLVQSLTDDPDYGSITPDISDDGDLVAYASETDPLGTNPDHNLEIFSYDAGRAITRQLTHTTEGDCYDPRISGNGRWVYFLSDGPIFGSPFGRFPSGNVYRVEVATGAIERAGALSEVWSVAWEEYPLLTVDGDGGRLAYVSATDPMGEEIPGSLDLWLADFDTAATIRPSAEAPTVVEWDPDPRAVHYDVIRGDVAALAVGPGDTVDLGTVTCLENDTLNTSTAGAEADATQPVPGQVFFFLRRWTQGPADGPGSYGQGSGGAARVPGAGDCPS